MASLSLQTKNKVGLPFCIFMFFQFVLPDAHAQMRQVYNDVAGNDIKKISFISPKEGYVAFTNWIGYTLDSGRTFTQKPITTGNVNYNGYNVNLTFGFGVSGVQAFNQNTIVVYGDYGLVPSILYSLNGGNSFTLIYHSQYNASQLSTGITDMVFPQNGSTGYAVDADRILKSTDQGLTWNVIRNDPGSFFDHLEAVDVNNIFALTTGFTVNKLLKTSNAGNSWQLVTFPALSSGKMTYATFLNATTGWLNMYDGNSDKYLYKTVDGGSNWILQNDIIATPFECTKMKFSDINTGYALTDLYTAYKTSNSGVTWEPLPRDNNFTYLGYSHDDLFFISAAQFWAGGGHGFLEISTNSGGVTLPKAYFKIDTAGVAATTNVNLLNYSKTGYTYKWFLNGSQISTSYNTSYSHNIYRSVDSIKLVVSNGTLTDTTLKLQYFVAVPPPNYPTITSFAPISGYPGLVDTITGTNFTGAMAVNFGGTPASSFTVVSATQIRAVVANGASGNVSVTTPVGTASKPGFIFATRLKINSFSPVSGPVGTLIAINGTNFGATINDNIVYLGAVKATVISASSNQLVVRSEAGSSYQPITVTVNGFTVFSDYFFLTTFDNGSTIDSSSFAQKTTFTSDPATMLLKSDLDGDGKPDLITADLNSSKISVLKNTSTGGSVSFDPKVNFTVDVRSAISVGDIDGDGKLDLLTNGFIPSGFNILKNTSTTGVINFAPPLYIPNTYNSTPDFMSVADFNGDGKPDIFGVSNNINIQIFKNTTSGGSTSFNLLPNIHMNWFYIYNCKAADFDGDGKPDIVATNASYTSQNLLYFYKNISVNDSIMFADPYPQISYPVVGNPGKIAIGDYDGDGKLDVAVIDHSTSGGSGTVSILRNTSTIGTISFAPKVSFGYTKTPLSIAADDLNGDGKPDLAFSNDPEDSVVVLENTSVPGTISFGNDVKFKINPNNSAGSTTILDDLNGDGKADIALVGGTNLVTVLLNNGGYTLVELCSGGGTITSDISGSTYQWQQNSGSGFVNISDNANFSGTATAVLQLTNIPVSWNNYKYRCVVNSNQNSKTFKITVLTPATPTITITTPSLTICAGTSVTFSSVVTNGGNAPSYQWQVNGTNAGTNSSTFATSSLNNGDQVKCFLISNASCITTPNTTSNIITISVNPTVVPDVSITTPTPSVCSGSTVTFTALPVNGGNTPSYQWKVNGINAGTNSATFTSNTLSNNDQVKVVLTSNSACAAPTTATSNIVTMTVTANTPVSISIAASNSTVCAGTPVTFTATTVNGGNAPVYQWQVNGVNTGINSSTFTSNSLNNNDQVKCLLISNASCVISPNATSNIIAMVITTPVVPSISISTATPIICSGSTVTFTAAVINGGSGPTYQWQVNGVNAGTNSSTFTTNTLNNGDQVSCVLNSNAGCVTTNTSTSNIVTITVSTTVTPSSIISTGTTNVCAGTSVTFTASPTNGGANPSYQWQVNGVNAGTNSNSFTSSALTNNAQVKVILTSSLSCALPATATSNIITMTVAAAPVANAGNDIAICAGSSTQLNGAGGTSYSWTPATGLSNASIANPIASPATTTAYVLTVTNGANCFAKDTVLVTVNPITPAPSVNISNPVTTICSGSPATFTAAAINGGSSPIYQWQVNAVNAGSNSSTFASNALSNNDQVKVTLTSNASCVANNTATSNIITMVVQQLATPIITISNRIFTVSNPDPAATYVWQIQTNNVWNDIVPATTGITYTAQITGVYRVKAIKGVCISYSGSQTASLIVRLPANNPYGIYLYPNPGNGIITIDSIRLSQNWETLDIIDATGRRILPSIDIKNKTTVAVDVNSWRNGTYFFQLRKKDGEFTTLKFVKL